MLYYRTEDRRLLVLESVSRANAANTVKMNASFLHGGIPAFSNTSSSHGVQE
jgi:hypothetical protein